MYESNIRSCAFESVKHTGGFISSFDRNGMAHWAEGNRWGMKNPNKPAMDARD